MKKLLLLTTALVAAAAPAHAGPVVAAAAWVGSTLMGGGLAAFALSTGLSMGLSAIGNALMKPDMSATASVSFDVQMGDDLPLSFVAGDYPTAGKRKYLESWGKNTRFITEVIEISALPQGFAAIWVNDELGRLVSGRRGYVSSSAEWGRVKEITEGTSVPAGSLDVGQPLENLASPSARIWVKWVNGNQTAADPFLTWAFGSRAEYPWTSAMVGKGKTYAIVTTRYDTEDVTSYPTYLFQPAPLPFYDLRFDSTNGGSGTQRWGNPATWPPTRNPAVIAYNIARGIYSGSEWVYGGKNLPAWRLPSAEWIAAANACDAPVARAGGGTEPRYRCGLEITVDTEPASVMEEIGKAANMKFAEVGGRLKPIVDLPGSAVFSITDGDILITEGQSFAPFYPLSETYNTISATYPEPQEKWASKDAPVFVDEAAKAKHEGRHLPTSMTYGAVPYAGQVQRLMRAQMKDYQRQRQHQFYLPPDAYALEPGIDLVSYSSERNGYASKQFMVERVSKTPGMNVLVSLREVDPGDYDWSSEFEQPITITPPVNPVPFVQPIEGLTVTGVIIFDAAARARRSVIRVSCDGDEVGVTHIQMERRISGQSQVTVEPLYPFIAPHVWDLKDVIPGQMYEVRARLLSERTPRSIWSEWHLAQAPVVGLSWDDLTGEVRDDWDAAQEWMDGTGGYVRDIRDEIDGMLGEVLEGDSNAFVQRDIIRREAGEIRADIVRESIARATETGALAGLIDEVRVSVGDKASSSALNALTTRVDETEDGLAVQSDAITLVEAKTDRGTAGGLFRVTAESGPANVLARAALSVSASSGGPTTQAALYLDAKAGGISQLLARVDRMAWVTGPNDAPQFPLVADNGIIYINEGRVRTLSVGGNAITAASFISGMTNDLMLTYVLDGPPGETYQVFVLGSSTISVSAWLRLYVNGSERWAELPVAGQLASRPIVIGLQPGTHTIRLLNENPANSNNASLYVLATKR